MTRKIVAATFRVLNRKGVARFQGKCSVCSHGDSQTFSIRFEGAVKVRRNEILEVKSYHPVNENGSPK